MAKLINQECGAVVAPWEIEQIEDEWLDVFQGLEKLPEMRKSYQAFEKRLAERRREHPTYRKYQ